MQKLEEGVIRKAGRERVGKEAKEREIERGREQVQRTQHSRGSLGLDNDEKSICYSATINYVETYGKATKGASKNRPRNKPLTALKQIACFFSWRDPQLLTSLFTRPIRAQRAGGREKETGHRPILLRRPLTHATICMREAKIYYSTPHCEERRHARVQAQDQQVTDETRCREVIATATLTLRVYYSHY